MSTNPLDPTGAIAQNVQIIETACAAITVAITPAPIPIPPTPIPPTPIPPSGVVPLLADDFTSYQGKTANLMAVIPKAVGGTGTGKILYNDGGNAQLASIDTTVLYNGHPTMKYTQPGGSALTPELWPNLPSTLSTMWFRGKIRWSPGFTTTGTLGNSANAYKIFGWGWDTTDGRGSVELTNTTQYSLFWSIIAKSGGKSASSILNGPSITTEWTDGAWYDYIAYYNQSSATTIQQAWWLAKDGQTPVLSKGITGTAPAGLALPKVNRVMVGINFNQNRAASQNQAVWWGSWEVIDGSKYPDPYHLL